MSTILGPVKGVRRAEAPALRLWAVSGGWQVVLAQWVLLENGWDLLTMPSADMRVYAQKDQAQQALAQLTQKEVCS